MKTRWLRPFEVLVLLALCVPAATAYAEEPAKTDSGVEKIELEKVEVEKAEIEQVEVAALEAVDADENPNAIKGPADLIGRLHPSLVHLPIAWLLLLLLVEVVAPRKPKFGPVSMPLAWLTVLSFVAAGLTGFLRMDHFAEQGTDMADALLHRNMMLVSFALTLGSAVLKTKMKNATPSSGMRYASLLLIVVATVLVSVGGHIGGELVYGEDYLPF